jgi:small GTP-binding protein
LTSLVRRGLFGGGCDYRRDAYHVNIWNTAGQEQYRCLVPVYCRGVQGAFLVFDTTSLDSFNNLPKWIDLYQNSMELGPVIVFGNKIDL